MQVMPGGKEDAEGTTMLPRSRGKSCYLRPSKPSCPAPEARVLQPEGEVVTPGLA